MSLTRCADQALGSTNGASKNHSVSENQVVFRRIDELMALDRASCAFFHVPAWGVGQENIRFERLKGMSGTHQAGETKILVASYPSKSVAGSPSSVPFRLFQLHGTYMALFES
ncbi:hypothetical protein [Pseudomonas brassicacearum]|uniref:hypothetical protein n=1 Tax=Pseudomonas brassicacearum TaxID=930166 RepID=UPI003D6BF0CA